MHNHKLALKLLFVLLIFVLGADLARAATLFYSPSSRTYSVGSRFSVSVIVESTDQAMNAVSANITFPANLLEITSISQAGSVIGFWVQEPGFSNQNGTAFFEGVVLNGYRGSSGRLVTLNFRAKTEGRAVVRTSSGTVLANDGLGSTLPLSLNAATFNIIEAVAPEFEIPDTFPPDFRFTQDLSRGQTSLEVAYLQLCLRSEGYYSEAINGNFNAATRQAVIDFQEEYASEILAPGGLSRGTGLVAEGTRNKLNEICPPQIPAQLFDINVRLESDTIFDASELEAVISFESFGTEATPVEITYSVTNAQGQVVFKDFETTVVETEKVVRKNFGQLVLQTGNYVLTVETLYNTDVVDQFTNRFTVAEAPKESIFESLRFWIGLVILLGFLNILFIIIIIIQKKRRKKSQWILEDIEKALKVIKKHPQLAQSKKENILRVHKDMTDLEAVILSELENKKNSKKTKKGAKSKNVQKQ